MRINPVRRLYDWVLAWAERPSAQVALFVFAFAESSFFPVPPDVLLIPLVLGYRRRWFRLALTVTVASAIGGVFGYLIGWKLWWTLDGQLTTIADFFIRVIPGFSEELFFAMRRKYDLYNFWIVFTAGFTPIPYKIITISAGAFKINFTVFLIASIISRGARFFMVSFLIYRFGKPIKAVIDRYFNWMALLFAVLLIAGFLLLKGIF